MAQTHNWLDAAIGWVAPKTALERATARRRLAALQPTGVQHRSYEGASRRDGWHPARAGASAQADHMMDARELRHRARSLASNVPYVAQALNVMVSCTVGQGIVPRWMQASAQGGAATTHARATQLWNNWVRHADHDGLLDFYGLQAKAWLAMKTDGEVLIRLRHVQPEQGQPIPLRLQLLEIDWLDAHKHATHEDGGETIGGIEYTANGQRRAYWLFERHPGDMRPFAVQRESQRVPAEEIIHLFNPARPGQQAGISALAPVIAAVRDLNVYEDAEQARKNMESRMSIIGQWDSDMFAGGLQVPKELKEAGDAVTLQLGELAGGGVVALPPGMNTPTFIQPAAVPGYVDYVKHRQKIIASGLGIPYEYMTGDLSEVNFSSSRVRTNLYKKDVEREQWTLLVPMFCERIARRWLELAALADAPLGDGPWQQLQADWTTPRWASVNPLQDVAADLAEIRGGLCSVSEKNPPAGNGSAIGV